MEEDKVVSTGVSPVAACETSIELPSLSDVLQVLVSPNQNKGAVAYCLLLHKTHRLDVLAVESRQKIIQTIAEVQSVCWRNIAVEPTVPRESEFILIDNQNNALIYRVTSSNLHCQVQWHHHTIRSILHDAGLALTKDSSLSLIGFSSNRLVIRKDSSHIVIFRVPDSQPPEVIHVLPLEEGEQQVQVQGNLLAISGEKGSILLYDILSGRDIGKVEGNSFLNLWGQQFEKVQHFVISDDFETLSIIDGDKIYKINLIQYFHHFSNHCKLRQKGDDCDDDDKIILYPWEKLDEHSLQKRNPKSSRWQKDINKLHSKCNPKIPGVASLGSTCATEQGKVAGLSAKRTFSGFIPREQISRHTVGDTLQVCFPLEQAAGEWRVRDFCASGKKLTMWFTGTDQCSKAVGILDYSVGKMYMHSLTSKDLVGLSRDSRLPHLVMTPAVTYLLMSQANSETLVNRVMMHESATVADQLCQQNSWDRCSIPLHALEAGLKHRQLDTVAFYLKSRENVFLSQGNSDYDPAAAPPVPRIDLPQLEEALPLLVKTIKEHIHDHQSKQFGEQLLHLTLHHLHKLVSEAAMALAAGGHPASSPEQDAGQLREVIQRLTAYIKTLRSYLKDVPSRRLPRLVWGGPPTVLTRSQDTCYNKWQDMDMEAVIAEGILENIIPVLQIHLEQKHGPKFASFEHITRIGQQAAFKYLSQQNLKLAAKLFTNLGYNCWEKLETVCMYTTDRQVRNYLVKELSQLGQLSREEQEMVTYVQRLETLYSCTSFEQAVSFRMETTPGLGTQIDPLGLDKLLGDTSVPNILSECGEIAVSEFTNSETDHYAEIVLEWVRGWDKTTRDRILLDLFIYMRDQGFHDGIAIETVVEYLAAHNDAPRILSQVISYVQQREGLGKDAGLRNTVSGILQALSHGSNYTRETVLTELSRQGVFQPCASGNLSELQHRLCRSHCLFSQPHPLQLHNSTHNIQLESFHQHFIRYCVEHQLPQVLITYLDYYSIAVENYASQDLGSMGERWLETLSSFRQLAAQPTDPVKMFQASLSTSRCLQHSSNLTLGHLLSQSSQVAQALATLMYAPCSLGQIIQGAHDMLDDVGSISREDWERALALYPRLSTTLLPRDNSPAARQDITLYKLMQGTCPFDPCGLFGWQQTNSLATEEASKELLHFAHSELASRYAHEETLNYIHYLRQGRPSFAFAAWLASLLQLGVRHVSSKRVSQLKQKVEPLGLANFHNLTCAVSCVAMLEMVGCPSLPLRLHLQAAARINAYISRQVATPSGNETDDTGQSHVQETVRLLLPCMNGSRKKSQNVLALLEKAQEWHLEKNSIDSTSQEAAEEWSLSVLFGSYHNLRHSLTYLQACAERDKWLQFLTFAQIHKYPKEQLLGAVECFSSQRLKEHLRYVVENAQTGASSRHSKQSRDVRAQLYSRIGLDKEAKDESGSTCSSSEEESIEQDTANTTIVEEAADTIEEFWTMPMHGDIFHVLFRCQSVSTPHIALLAQCLHARNPVLAVLAACFQESELLDCLCCWLYSSLPEDEVSGISAGTSSWQLEDLSALIQVAVRTAESKLLLQALEIFQSHSPLVYFAKFCHAFLSNFLPSECKIHLDQFRTAMLEYYRTSSHEDLELPLLGDTDWLEGAIWGIIETLILRKQTSYELSRLLKVLDESGATRHLTQQAYDLKMLHQLQLILYEVPALSVDFCQLLQSSRNTAFIAECERIVSQMQAEELYSQARQFAVVAGVSTDQLNIGQLKQELCRFQQSSMWMSDQGRHGFWMACNNRLKEWKVSPLLAAKFFEKQGSQCHASSEQVMLYQLSYDWLTQDDVTAQVDELQSVYLKIWTCKIQMELDSDSSVVLSPVEGSTVFSFPDVNAKPLNSLEIKKQLLHFGRMPRTHTPTTVLSLKEQGVLDKLLGLLLDQGQIDEACKVAAVFNHSCQDLAIVLTCIRLAQGSVSVDEIDDSMQYLVTSPSSRRRSVLLARAPAILRTESSMSLAGHMAQYELGLQQEETAEIVSAIENLAGHCSEGQQCCERILTWYKIALVLERSYEWVVCEESYSLLKALLTCNSDQKFVLARGYIKTSQLSDPQVAGFLVDAVVSALWVVTGAAAEDPSHPSSSSELVFNPTDGSGAFKELIKLSADSSVLGNRLLDAAVSMATSSASQKVFSIQVELLIYAHDCHTVACNMDGISNVLRAARVCSNSLARAEEFTLMIRLLTGVGRFSEMTYVFDTLKQQHQFELLFRKGMDKENKLKLAVLDWLKHYHPTDSDTYTMVSLHFTMYREIAQMLQEQAYRHLRTLRNKTMDNSPDVQEDLKNIVQYFSEAAESYVKEGCLRHAEQCVKQARLVALQSHLLAWSGSKVINLDEEAVTKFVHRHNKFYEGYIVADAYSRHGDWAGAVYHQVIVNKDFKYLQDMRPHIKISPTLVAEVADRLKKESSKSSSMVTNMKKLLEQLQDRLAAYRLARDLGFTDVCMDMVKADVGGYLQDAT